MQESVEPAAVLLRQRASLPAPETGCPPPQTVSYRIPAEQPGSTVGSK